MGRSSSDAILLEPSGPVPFDQAWQQLERSDAGSELSPEQRHELRKQQALEACADHPFMLSDPAMAAQVADFRIRLLGP